MTNATNKQPCQVDTYVKSDTHITKLSDAGHLVVFKLGGQAKPVDVEGYGNGAIQMIAS